MPASSTRRTWIALCTGALVGLAGCSGLLEGEGDDDAESTDDDLDSGESGDDDPDGSDVADESDDSDDEEADDSDDEESDDDAEDDVSVGFDLESLSEHTPNVAVVTATEYPDEEGVTFEWDVDGEALSQSGPVVIHEFDAAGDHEIALRVDVGDGTGSHAETITVDEVPEPSMPIAGDPVGELAELERAVIGTAADLEAHAFAMAVGRDGDLVAHRAFGYRDGDGTDELALDALFRIASLTKPITRAATARLVRESHLTWDSRVFEELDVEPPGDVRDERIYDITIEMCLDHTLGWARDEGLDPLAESRDVSIDLGLDRPATTEELVGAVMTTPLEFEPGTDQAYTNIGYCILGLLIEQESGMDWYDYVVDHVLEPAGIDPADVQPGASFPADRPAREVEYDDHLRECRIDVLDTCDRVAYSDGGYDLEAFLPAAGLVSTPDAYLEFLAAYDVTTGEPRAGPVETTDGHTGQFQYGTSTIAYQTEDGIDVVAFFNSSGRRVETHFESLNEVVMELDPDDLPAP